MTLLETTYLSLFLSFFFFFRQGRMGMLLIHAKDQTLVHMHANDLSVRTVPGLEFSFFEEI